MDVMGTAAIWAAYVRELMGNDKQTEVAYATGVRQATLSRWANGVADATPIAGNVAAFCKHYERSPLEGFVAAGILELADAQAGLDDEALGRLARLFGAVPIEDPAVTGTKSPQAKRVPNPRD